MCGIMLHVLLCYARVCLKLTQLSMVRPPVSATSCLILPLTSYPALGLITEKGVLDVYHCC